jgi:hypothetical protein
MATPRAALDLPEPAGPSTAITKPPVGWLKTSFFLTCPEVIGVLPSPALPAQLATARNPTRQPKAP